ncbi:MAG TPA: kelch repeat-containing protein [Holophagaceae bacterium]|nr:kelch repeat-containing protein [Holophagaceae bacterium]
MRIRLLPVLLAFVALLGCSKSEDGGSIPTIVEFTPTSAHINPGGTTLLVPNFMGGTASIDQGVGPVTSGVPVSVSPAATTTYTLTVLGSKGDVAVAKATVVVGLRSLEITPAQVALSGGQTTTFTAVATGLADPTVTWFAEEGTIDALGNHTAPNASKTYKVTATSVEDPTLCAKAFVTTTRVPIFISVESPGANAVLLPGESFTTLYSVFGASNPAVTFNTTIGSVTPAGIFTAPMAVGTGTVTIRSVEDPTVTATIAVTVTPLVLPRNQAVAPGASFPFRAVLLGVANPAVTWSVSGGGTVDPVTGVFTADTTTSGNVTLTATSVANPALQATATITLNPGYAFGGTASPNGTPMATPRKQHSAVRDLYDNVLVTGGTTTASPTGSTSIEYYRRFGGDYFSNPGVTLGVARSRHSSTLLPTGRILITGGRGTSGAPLASAEIYDPYNQTITPVAAPMTVAREDHAAVLLPNGLVLLAGGTGSGGTPLSSLELFDPVTRTFSPAGTMSDPRLNFTAELLLDGHVLLAGGSRDGTDANLSISADLFNPLTKALTPATGSLPFGVWNAGAMVAPNGLVGILGGVFTPSVPLVQAGGLAFAPATGTFGPTTSSMTGGRNRPLVVTLADGRALVLGGTSDLGLATALTSLDYWTPTTKAFSTNPAPANGGWVAGLNGRAVLLDDGSVLVCGDARDALGLPVVSERYQ